MSCDAAPARATLSFQTLYPWEPMMFALVVRFDLLDPASADRFDALVADLLPQIAAAEPGTLSYLVHTVVDAPLSRVFYECYVDRDAFNEHERQPHTRHFLTERVAYCSGDRVEFLDPVGSVGPR
jgi:quinol monooxygenase YgiN